MTSHIFKALILWAATLFCGRSCIAEFPNRHTMQHVENVLRKSDPGMETLAIEMNKRMFPLEVLLDREVIRPAIKSSPVAEMTAVSVVYQYPVGFSYLHAERVALLRKSGYNVQQLRIDRPQAVVTISRVTVVNGARSITNDTLIVKFEEQVDSDMNGKPDHETCWIPVDDGAKCENSARDP